MCSLIDLAELTWARFLGHVDCREELDISLRVKQNHPCEHSASTYIPTIMRTASCLVLAQ